METEIKKIIEELLSKTNFDFTSVSSELDMDSGSIWFLIESKDANHLIGKDGETIQSLNYLVKRFLDKKYKENAPQIIIDVNNYQKLKIEKIKTIAHMMSERARFFKSKIELDPMNSFERRIVHEYVSKQGDLSSESAGFGKDRHIVISFINK
ncbi:MAG: spoIIIJ-associated protein [Patescibacteria group bacterium]|nr:spoIIIJ-associated protein [Patescibacteria group bacterium]